MVKVILNCLWVNRYLNDPAFEEEKRDPWFHRKMDSFSKTIGNEVNNLILKFIKYN